MEGLREQRILGRGTVPRTLRELPKGGLLRRNLMRGLTSKGNQGVLLQGGRSYEGQVLAESEPHGRIYPGKSRNPRAQILYADLRKGH